MFKRDVVMCKGISYVDLANLQDHIITTHKSGPFKKKLLSKLKSIMDMPKRHGIAMVQTVHKNMEGFTKQDLQGAYLACKDQSVLAHPLEKLS